ncbi:alcohol dehydrogenase catalytic domain-containing protein [Clostridiaceae bacterium 35-E11]
MIAIVKEKKGPGFAIKEVNKPVIKEDEVLIKVISVGICGSDIPILGGTRDVPFPMIPGHEFAGDIAEVGSKVNNFKVGDRVTAALVIGCGNCKFCVDGKESLCEELIETGIHVDGAFAEYVAVPAKTVFKLSDSMTYDQGASIDPIASAYRTVKKANLGSKDVVVIYGPGPIGLYAIQTAKVQGPKTIINIGVKGDEKRLAIAKEIGADYVINASEENVVERIREITNGEMVDVVLDATGHPSIVDPAIEMLKKGGTLAITGIFHKPVQVNLGKVVRSELNIFGTICYTRNEYKECIDLVERGRVVVEPLISHYFDLRDMDKAWDVIQKRESIKIILKP